jgi:nucleoside-diphosphate-sugar epimerase
MTVLVTGGTGFVGLNVVERLAAEGYDIVALGHAAPPWHLPEAARRRAEIVVGDVRSVDALEEALAGRRPKRIVHAAAMTPSPERERDQPDQIASVNLGGTIAVLQLAQRFDVERVVVLSSVAVYGAAGPEQGRLAAARTSPKPTSLYGITKLAAEQAALYLGALEGIDVRAVRLGPVFGRYEYATGLRDALSPHSQIVASAKAGDEARLPRACAADWIYAPDAAAGIVGVLEVDQVDQRVFDLGGGWMTDATMWCEAIAAHFPQFRWRIVQQGDEANVAYRLPYDRAPLDNAAIAAATGFEPRFDLRRAAVDYLEWCRVALA